MGRLERVKHMMRMLGYNACVECKGWTEVQPTRTMLIKKMDTAFSLPISGSIVTIEGGNYLVQDPATGFVTVFPAVVVDSLFAPYVRAATAAESDPTSATNSVRD